MENNGKRIAPSSIPFNYFKKPQTGPRPSIVDSLSKKIPVTTTVSKNPLIITPSFSENNRFNVLTGSGLRFTVGYKMDSNPNDRTIKRLIANRIATNKWRIKKINTIAGLELTAKKLEEEIRVSKSLMERERETIKMLELEKTTLKIDIFLCQDQIKPSLATPFELQRDVAYNGDMYQKQQMPLIGSSFHEDWSLPMLEIDEDFDLEALLSDL